MKLKEMSKTCLLINNNKRMGIFLFFFFLW